MVKLYNVKLSDEQRTHLQELIRTGSSSAQVQNRARILLLAERGDQDTDIAQALLTSPSTVQRTRVRCVTEGLDSALYPKPRTGRPPIFTGETEAYLTTLACSAPPAGRAQWTLQLLADQLITMQVVDTISDSQVRNMLKKTGYTLGK
jgi:transposase